MGKMNQLSLMQSEASSEFVPSYVQIGGMQTSIVWRNRLGAVRIKAAGYTDASKKVLVVYLESGDKYSCKVETFGTSEFPTALVDAVKSAVASGTAVELCVALNPRNQQAASGYFCGLRVAGSATGETLIAL